MAAPRSRPLCSMTGYGRGQASNRHAACEVEFRSVNGRGLNVKLRLPSDRLGSEPAIEARVRKALERGSVQGLVRVQVTGHGSASLDHALLRRYLRDWRATEKALGLEQRDPGLGELLALPGAVEPPRESGAATRGVERALGQAAGEALEALVASREREGERLRRELLSLVGRLERDLEKVRKRLPAAAVAAAQRLRERVGEAWKAAGITEPLDLAREIVLLAERADVREEVARLGIHLERLAGRIGAGGPCGRELEFLIQECHREVTTLGSKSADPRLSELVVSMKTAVGQLKEQCANVE